MRMTSINKIPNPLLAESQLKNMAIPFSEIRPEHYLPAIKSAIESAKKAIHTIKTSTETPDFENTIVALECATEDLELASSTFFSILSAHTNDSLQALAQELGPMISAFQSDVVLDQELFKRVQFV